MIHLQYFLHVVFGYFPAGANVNARNAVEENSLNVALMNGHADVAEFLLEQGLEVCSPGEYSQRYITCSILLIKLHEKLSFLLLL